MPSNDVEINPGPSFANYSNTVRGTFDQGNQLLFGNNAGNQCVANSLIAVVFNAGINCFLWDRGITDRILHIAWKQFLRIFEKMYRERSYLTW